MDRESLIQQQLMLQHQAQAAQQPPFSLYHQLQNQQQAQLLRNSFNSPPPRQQNVPNSNPNPSSDPLLQQKNKVEMQLAYQDAWKVCHPDFKRPFSSLEDACERLLPYHVVADYEDEEDDKILDSDTTGQILSRSQQWDNNIAVRMAEFTAAFEELAQTFNKISRMRALGEFRLEERLMIEKSLIVEEKQALYKLRTEIESRERANHEAQFRIACAMVQAEQARRDPQATVGPLRGSVVGYQGSGHEMREREHGVNNAEMVMSGWGNNVQRDEREPLEDFLNDEETDNRKTSRQHAWHQVGEFDLNSR